MELSQSNIGEITEKGTKHVGEHALTLSIVLTAVATAVTGYLLVKEFERSVVITDIVNANFRISELLTRNIRDYIIHNDKKYEEAYWKTVSIRTGSTPWDELYKLKWFEEKTETLRELYDWADFHPEDRKYLDDAIDASTELIWNEIQAMNWKEGRYDTDGSGRAQFDAMGRNKTYIQFKDLKEDKKEEGRQKAIDILYSKDYLARKKEVEAMTQEGVHRILDRRHNIERSYTIVFFSLLVINVILNIVNVFMFQS